MQGDSASQRAAKNGAAIQSVQGAQGECSPLGPSPSTGETSPSGKDAKGAGLRFETTVPLFEWQGDPAREIMFDFDGVDRSETAHELFELELAYQRSDFSTARHLADNLIATSDDEWVVLSAIATRIATAIAANRANVAYLCLPGFVRQCQEGLDNAQDPVLYGTCLMCARRIETLLMARALLDLPMT